MKGLGFQTILLASVIVLVVVSVSLMGFAMYRVTTGTGTLAEFWKNNKLFLITPTVINVMAMALLAVLIMTG